jgi:hypothetical protein
MNSSHIKNDIASAIRQYGATVRASLSTDEAGPVSYAGLWLLLASLAPVVTEAEEFRNTLGLTVKEAGDDVAGLLEHPHPTVAAALGAWLAQDVTLAGDLPVTLEKLPSQDALDKWANDKTGGLLDTFPLQLEPEIMLVLASALVLTPRWSGGVSYDDEDDTLLLAGGLQAVVGTSIGPVAVTKPATNDGVDVISVIAAPDVPPAKVWDAVEEVVARLDAGELRNNSFPDDMPAGEVERGHAWASHETMRSYWGDAPEDGSEVWEARLPVWSATTTHDLTDAPGVALVPNQSRHCSLRTPMFAASRARPRPTTRKGSAPRPSQLSTSSPPGCRISTSAPFDRSASPSTAPTRSSPSLAEAHGTGYPCSKRG